MKHETTFYPRWRWSTKMECVVEVLKRGHFPDTLVVQLPDGNTTELEESQLITPPKA